MTKDIIIFLLSIVGFINAWYLHYQYKRQQNTGQKMFCIIGGECGEVVGSRFGTTLGFKNEVIGMSYYVLIGISSIASMFFQNTQPLLLIFMNTVIAFACLFSLYLFVIQTMVLRKICSWCLIAIVINIIIFNVLFFKV